VPAQRRIDEGDEATRHLRAAADREIDRDDGLVDDRARRHPDRALARLARVFAVERDADVLRGDAVVARHHARRDAFASHRLVAVERDPGDEVEALAERRGDRGATEAHGHRGRRRQHQERSAEVEKSQGSAHRKADPE